MKMEAETEAMPSKSATTGREVWTRLPPTPLEGTAPASKHQEPEAARRDPRPGPLGEPGPVTPWFPASRTVREYIAVVSSHPAGGALFVQP